MSTLTKKYEMAALAGLPKLNIPPFDILLRPSGTSRQLDVYDPIRARWVALTPEEWVRQHFVNFLVEHRGYSASHIANEVSLTLNGTQRRADTIIYDHALKPVVIVEYKSPDIQLTQSVAEQALRYNLVLGAPFVVVSNGMDVYAMRRDISGSLGIIRGIPNADNL